MLLCAIQYANAAYNLEFDGVSPSSSFQMEPGGSAEKGYTFKVVNPDAAVPAFVSFKKFANKVDPKYRMLTFEYMATGPESQRVLSSMISLNFINSTGTGSSRIVHHNTYTTGTWCRMSFDIGPERDKGLGFGRINQSLWVHFVSLPAGSSVTIRNAKLEEYEFAESPIEISAGKTSFIAPEAFNQGAAQRLRTSFTSTGRRSTHKIQESCLGRPFPHSGMERRRAAHKFVRQHRLGPS